ALQHAYLGHIGEAEEAVRGRIVELGGVEQPPVHGRDDFSTGERVYRSAHPLEQVDGNAHGPVFHALEVIDLGDRLLEPTERLGRVRSVGERDHVQVEGRVKLG